MSGQSTYALLIYRSEEAELTSERAEQALVGHRALQAQTRDTDLLAVAKLGDASAAKTVVATQNSHEIADGPFIESKEWLVGFYLLECESEAEALERAKMLCPLPDHVIEVRPVDWRWAREKK